MTLRETVALLMFNEACAHVKATHFDKEIRWQRNLAFGEFTESDLLRESAWVILSTGFRVSIVERYFDYISLCFCDWESANAIVQSATECVRAAAASIRNERKLHAIAQVARRICEFGFARIRNEILRDPISVLRTLPYIGPVTAWHLAKNLGANVAKSDRHLERLSSILGYEGAHALCAAISVASGERISVVDLILWRFMADCHQTAEHLVRTAFQTHRMPAATAMLQHLDEQSKPA